jgi:hypothetical protein
VRTEGEQRKVKLPTLVASGRIIDEVGKGDEVWGSSAGWYGPNVASSFRYRRQLELIHHSALPQSLS